MDKKEAVLKHIMAVVPVNMSGNFSFSNISKETGIEKSELNKLLIELDREGYITEFPVAGDNFKVNVNEKSLTYNFTL